METLTEKVGDVNVIRLKGRLDLAAAPDFEKLLRGLISAGDRKIVLDCQELKYVSSSGLGAFIAAGKGLGSEGKLIFCGLSNQIRSLFEMTGIINLFVICANQDEAMQQFGSA